MSMSVDEDPSGFVEAPEDSADFVTDAPKGPVKRKPERTARTERTYTSYRTTAPPKDDIEERRKMYSTSPHMGHAVEVVLDWMLADGHNVSARTVTDFGESMDTEDVAELRRMLADSDFDRKLHDWIETAAVEGHGFMELVVDDEGNFQPRLLPFKRIHKFTNQYGIPQEYVLEPPEGGGPDSDDAIVYDRHEVAEIYFRKSPLEDFGHPLIERGMEQADMLRDMEIDFARFVASKAYPPIFWKFGTEDGEWTEEQMNNWLDDVEEVEPDSVIGGPHDVEAEVIGVTSTAGSAGAMRLEQTFEHHERRIVTSVGIPAIVANMDIQGTGAEAVMPAFKRRISRYQTLINDAVEQQILKPLYIQSIKGQEIEDYDGLIPESGFGEYSNAENRLEIDKLIKLFNNGFLTREAFAKRAGIDPEEELPSMDQLQNEVIPTIESLAGMGDSVQNPDGGRPSQTGGGAQTSGREVTSRESGDTNEESDDARPQQSPTEE